jgi:UDP-N-acetylmuramate dehydrogenase
MQTKEILKKLTELQIEYKESISAKELTTICTGGLIDLLILPNSEQAFVNVLKLFKENQIEYRILGNGSNLIIPDNGIDIPVIKLGKNFKEIKFLSENSVLLGASCYLPTVAREICNNNLSGFEFAAGIPASVGGAIYMNAGAHGSEISKVISSIKYIDRNCEIKEITCAEVNWQYRKSNLPQDCIILSGVFSCIKQDKEVILDKFKENLENRKKNQPLQFPSFGSVFKNPKSELGAAGLLIEKSGLKGFQIGGAQVSMMHGNWIINPKKNATSQDVVSVLEEVQKKVFELHGITLEPEVIRW